MINDLDETLKQLLIQKAELDPSEVDISFDIPTRDWSTPVTRPTVNLYLYDIRENRQLRELDWDEEPSRNGHITRKRLPVRIDVSYMVTCWTSASEDQHRLLWRVLETFFRNSPLPDDTLQGQMKNLLRPARTEVAQPDGILKNVSDFWGALENQLRPAINVVVTLELDLNQITISPIVFAKVTKLGLPAVAQSTDGTEYYMRALRPGWEALPVRMGGYVRDNKGNPVSGASVRLIRTMPDGSPVQFGPTVVTREDGQYVLENVPQGRYTFVVEAAGQTPVQHPLTVVVRERGEPLGDFIHEVEVPMK
jgi:Pvc16 N-terminal domain/Carboxypeptidase regulatory-like domain